MIKTFYLFNLNRGVLNANIYNRLLYGCWFVTFEYNFDVFKRKGSGIKNTNKVKYVSKDYVMKK